MFLVQQPKIEDDFNQILRTTPEKDGAVCLVAPYVQPTLNWEPSMELFTTTEVSVMFTSPTIKADVYIKSISITNEEDALGANAVSTVDFTSEIGKTNTVALQVGIANSNSVTVDFAGRGIKLGRGTTISTSSSANNFSAMVTLYRLPAN